MKSRFVILLVFSFLMFSNIVQCEITIRNIYTDSDTIRLGMCKVGEKMGTEFEIVNSGNENYKLSDVDPSFYLGTPRDSATNHYEEFYITEPDLPVQIPAHSTLAIKITYGARPELSVYPVGIKIAMLKIGLIPASLQTQPSDKDLVAYREFILIAKKTNTNVDFYDNAINLDSVCMNPYNPVDYQTYIQNNSQYSSKILNEGFTSRTDSCLESELFRTDSDFSTDFSSIRQQKIRSFRYYPTNPGWDTAYYSVNYETNKEQFVATLKFTAFAAYQKMDLREAIGCKINGDTIETGDSRIGESVEIPVILKNSGNLNFGAISQNIFKDQSTSAETAFTVDRALLMSGKNLLPGASDTMKIIFKPDRQGEIIARCEIESDISKRKITNVNNISRKVIFYLKGNGAAPIFTLSPDTLDFGNIVISEDCPLVLDTFVTLYNPGNRSLKVFQTEINPNAGMPYVFNNSEFTIEAGKSAKFPVSFNSQGLPAGQSYNGQIIFHTNSINGPESVLNIKAATIPAQNFSISLPKAISAKTGRIIAVPILIDNKKITSATKFSCNLEYDKSILRYSSYSNFGNAAASSGKIVIIDTAAASTTIKIDHNGDLKFSSSDTLILLFFNTYLSDKYFTQINIRNVKLGNSVCDQIFKYDLANSNSTFTIDSICGLNFKTLPEKGAGTFQISNIYPNPCRNFIDIQFENPYACNVKLEIINSLGFTESVIFNEHAVQGVHNLTFDSGNLVSGPYLLKLTSGGNRTVTKQFEVVK